MEVERQIILKLALTLILLGTLPVAPRDGASAQVASVTDVPGVVVDIYQNMESGNPGDLLTPAIMNGSSLGGCEAITATWDFKYGDQMWVSTDHARSLPGTVMVDGTTYSGSSVTFVQTESKSFKSRVFRDFFVRHILGFHSAHPLYMGESAIAMRMLELKMEL